MGKRCCISLLLFTGLLAGCRQNPYLNADLQLMNAEKRALEDELYELGFDYEDAVQELEQLRRENASLRTSAGLPTKNNGPSPRRSRSDSSSKKDNLLPPMIDEGNLAEPQIEMPSNEPSRELPTPRTNGRPSSPPMIPGIPPTTSKKSADKQTPVSILAPKGVSLDPGDPRVTHLFINPLLTGGAELDQKPGEDGITVVIEPRNREEAFVPLAGPITVLVLDPEKTPEQGRVIARWEIDANEAQQLLQNTATLRGIQLKLRWPGTPPTITKMRLHVRYITVDNRDLRADREIFINLPGQFSQRWTPRGTGRAETAPPAAAPSNSSSIAQPEWRPYR